MQGVEISDVEFRRHLQLLPFSDEVVRFEFVVSPISSSQLGGDVVERVRRVVFLGLARVGGDGLEERPVGVLLPVDLARHVDRLMIVALELHVQAERLHFLHEHLEGLGHARRPGCSRP